MDLNLVGENDPVASEREIFLSYRVADGERIAHWLWTKLHGRHLDEGGRAGSRLSAYFNQAAEAKGDWSKTYLPHLQVSGAFIFICTPGSYSRLLGIDWVHRELDWWLENRPGIEPILVETLDDGDRWVPESIVKRWGKKRQRVKIHKDWTDEELATREAVILSQILGAIRPSEEKARFQDLQRLKRTNLRLRLTIAGLTALAIALGVAIGFAWQFYVKEQSAANLARQSAEEAKKSAKAADNAAAEALASKKTAEMNAEEALTSKKVADDKTTEALASKKVADEQRVIAVQEKSKAEQRSRALEARRLAAEAVNVLTTFPQRAVLLAVEAVRSTRDDGEPVEPVAETALRDVLRAVEGSVLLETDGPIGRFAAGSDGRRLVTSGGEGRGLIFSEEDRPPFVLRQSEGIFAFNLQKAGRWLAAAKLGPGSGVLLWDLDQPQKDPVKLPGLAGSAMAIQYHADGRHLVALDVQQPANPYPSSNSITTLKVWDLTRPTTIPQAIRGHYGADGFLVLSEGGRFAVSTETKYPRPTRDGTGPTLPFQAVWAWDLQRPGDEPTLLSSGPGGWSGQLFGEDGRHVAALFENKIEVRDLAKPRDRPGTIPLTQDSFFNNMMLLEDGQKLVASGSDRGSDASPSQPWLRLWDLEMTGAPTTISLLPRSSQSPMLLAPPSGRPIVVGPYEEINSASLVRSIYLHDPDRPGEPPVPLRGHEGHITDAELTVDGKGLLTSATDGTVRGWDLVRPSTEPIVLRGHAKRITTSGIDHLGRISPGWQSIIGWAIRPDGGEVATADIDGVFRIWGLDDPARTVVIPPKGPPNRPMAPGIKPLAYLPGGKDLIVVDASQIRRLDSEHPDRTPTDLISISGSPNRLEVGGDGRFLVANGYDPSGTAIGANQWLRSLAKITYPFCVQPRYDIRDREQR